MSKEQPLVEFIPASENVALEAKEVERVYPDKMPYSQTADDLRPLTGLAEQGNGVSRVSVPREVSRKAVVNAFTDAFELIGGVPRLAHWADQHPSAFFKLYARLLPTTAQQQIEHSGGYKVLHVLPKGPLDEEQESGT